MLLGSFESFDFQLWFIRVGHFTRMPSAAIFYPGRLINSARNFRPFRPARKACSEATTALAVEESPSPLGEGFRVR